VQVRASVAASYLKSTDGVRGDGSGPGGGSDLAARLTGAQADQAVISAEARRKQAEGRGPGATRAGGELTDAERREVAELRTRDREVRAHEQAHLAAAGRYAQGGANYETTTGPDGRRYAASGEVSIDASPVPGDPQATLEKAAVVRRAALAPADPSAQDLQVAARASRMAAEARAELAREAAGTGVDDRRGAGSAGRAEADGGAGSTGGAAVSGNAGASAPPPAAHRFAERFEPSSAALAPQSGSLVQGGVDRTAEPPPNAPLGLRLDVIT
jgi:hypothetical protein